MPDFTKLLTSAAQSSEARFSGFPQYNFVGGHIDADTIPVDAMVDAMSSVLAREGADLATYGLQSGPQGYYPLRQYVAAKLDKYCAIKCDAEDILLTSGSLQGMDLINQALLNQGDIVIVEESNYGGALSRFRKLGVDMEAIPLDTDGMLTDELEITIQRLADAGRSPKFIYTVPTVHNPTGSILSLERRHELLRIAAAYDIVIVEDECYADLVWSGERPPALYALDNDQRVIHIGTFSKTVAPALRVGYVAAPWSILGHIMTLKTDAGSGALEQMLLAEFCPDKFDKHLVKLNKAFQKKLDSLTAAIDREFGTSVSYEYPPGGIFLWVKFEPPVDTEKLAQVAGAEGVVVNPGHEWSLQGDSKQFIRLCFANPSVAGIDAGITKLARICHETFGVPEFGANKMR